MMKPRIIALMVLLCVLVTGRMYADVEPWKDEALVEVAIQVVDDEDGVPIKGASIWIVAGMSEVLDGLRSRHQGLDPIDLFASRVQCNKMGKVVVPLYFESHGTIAELENGTRVREGEWEVSGRIEVKKFGYLHYKRDLIELASARSYSISEERITITIRLLRELK